MHKKKVTSLSDLNNEIKSYLYAGYDLHFIHGWFSSYLSAPSDSEEDLVIPTYLILDEDSIQDEHKFAKTIDKLINVYSELADNIFEKNKMLRPLVDFNKPNSFDPLLFTNDHKQNLMLWLYGYLTGYLVTSGDVTEYAPNEKLLDDKFYPALFTLSVALIKLAKELPLDFMSAEMKADFDELLVDVRSMWESAENDQAAVEDTFVSAIEELDLADIVGALNDVFYVIRLSDEKRFASTQTNNTLLGKLSTRH